MSVGRERGEGLLLRGKELIAAVQSDFREIKLDTMLGFLRYI